MTFPPPPARVVFTAWCPACRVDHEWAQKRTSPASTPEPQCQQEVAA